MQLKNHSILLGSLSDRIQITRDFCGPEKSKEVAAKKKRKLRSWLVNLPLMLKLPLPFTTRLTDSRFNRDTYITIRPRAKCSRVTQRL